MIRRLGDPMRHVNLVSRMAKATGTDLVGAYKAGDLSQDSWYEMVTSCRACAWADRCDGWLDNHLEAPHAPESCPNRRRFAALQTMAELDRD